MERELSARYTSARERLVGIFEVQSEIVADPTLKGYAFTNANSEAQPGAAVEQPTPEFHAWIHTLFLELAQEAGARVPEQLAQHLVLVYYGAAIGALVDKDPSVAGVARSVAAALISSAVPTESE
jgi:hypothetical protein